MIVSFLSGGLLEIYFEFICAFNQKLGFLLFHILIGPATSRDRRGQTLFPCTPHRVGGRGHGVAVRSRSLNKHDQCPLHLPEKVFIVRKCPADAPLTSQPCSFGMDSPPSMRLIMSRETPHFIHSAYMLRPQASRKSCKRRGSLSRMRSA